MFCKRADPYIGRKVKVSEGLSRKHETQGAEIISVGTR